MTYSPITTEWLDLPEDIRSAAETAAGHLRPLTHAETLLIVGRAIKAERERCAQYAAIHSKYPIETGYERGYADGRRGAATAIRGRAE